MPCAFFIAHSKRDSLYGAKIIEDIFTIDLYSFIFLR